MVEADSSNAEMRVGNLALRVNAYNCLLGLKTFIVPLQTCSVNEDFIMYNGGTHTSMSRTAVEQIKERLNIVDVVGAYVELHKAGKSYKGKSPFTQEKTPSFFVSADRGVYFCFSTQKGGDMFTFIQEMEGVDFKGALKILAEKAQVELVPEDPRLRDARETEYALLEAAAQYFFDTRERSPHADEYVKTRGVSEFTIRAWRIGYAPDEWRALRSHLMEKGFTEKDIMRAGLIKQPEEGKESYDVFRDRIMFPIMDTSGRVVAFSGRTLKKEDGVPKYVNSPETDLYKKSEILYGYDRAKNSIRQYDFSLLVEGQFDLVMSHQAGYTNTVAVSGTAFTDHHLALLMRLSNRAVLALDADRAGLAAVKRVSAMMLAKGMDVKVAEMPFGKDPADVVRQDPQELKHAIGKAVHVIEFLLKVLKDDTKDDRAYKLTVREELLPLLRSIQSRIDREHFEGVVALAIGTTKDAVHYEVERLPESASKETVVSAPKVSAPKTMDTQGATRRTGIVHHLFAFHEALDESRATMRTELMLHLERLLSKEELDELKNKKGTPELERAFFEAESKIASLHPKELVSDLSNTLTTLAHLIARERLAYHRQMQQEAEQIGDEARVNAESLASKEAQNLLASTIDLSLES
jgi:DNA primase